VAASIRCAWLAIIIVGLSINAFAQTRPGASRPAQAGTDDTATMTPAPTSGTNPFLGSVPIKTPSSTPIALTLPDAIQRGLDHNLGVLTLEQEVSRASGSRWRSLSGLLPDVSAQAGETRQTTNLAAFGFDASVFPGIPPVIGPFDVFDARVFVSQPLVDLSAIDDVRRSGHELDAAKLESRNARDLVVQVVTDLYLQAAAASRRIDAVRSQVTTADSLLQLANQQHDAGVVPGIDVLRAQVQLRAQRQRLIAVQNDFAKAKLQLARAIGIPSAQPIDVGGTDVVVPRPALTLDQALQRAAASRTDYQASLARLHAAEADHRAAEEEALPTLHLNADIGAIGGSPGDARRTYSVAGTVQVPVFDAGQRQARLAETEATLRVRQAEAADFAERIASEVRTAFLDADAAEQQLAVTREQVDLANQELAQAKTRFAAGVASNLEVIQAQNEVATATESEIASEYAFNAAKAALARTLGSTGQEGSR
jgi:outer membrane protein TolC